MAGSIDIDVSLYPNITALYRIGPRDVEAHLGPRRFRVAIYEGLKDPQPTYSTNYEQRIEVGVAGRWLPLWVTADLPWEVRDSVDECLRAGLAHVDRA